MPAQPIGISFMPTADAQQQGPRQGQMEGDLAQAFKILSLRLPEVLGAKSLAPKRLLNAPGAAGISAGGASPYAAVFQALLQAALGGGNMPNVGGDMAPAFPGSPMAAYGGGGGVDPMGFLGGGTPPRVTPGDIPGTEGGGRRGTMPPEPAPPTPEPTPSGYDSGRPDYPGYEREHHWF